MSEMIERVARALARLEGVRDSRPFDAERLRRFVDETLDSFVPAARAAIEAMREPTEWMIGVGDRSIGHDEETLRVWQAMIDEALK